MNPAGPPSATSAPAASARPASMPAASTLGSSTLGSSTPAGTCPVRFVYFDLGNLLVSFDRGLACRAVGELFDVSPERADEVLHLGGLQNELESGRISEDAFARTLHERLLHHRPASKRPRETPPAAVPLEKIRRAISDMFTPVDVMADVIAQVRSLGLPVGILSNTCQAHWDWVSEQAWEVMAGPFDVTILSHQAKSMKPDAAIYQLAEQHAHRIAGATPEEILFLDDREENVLAARARRWRSEVCFGGDEAITALRRHHLPILPSGAADQREEA